MIAFVDQSGQLGGAELCLADLAQHYASRGRVILFAEGPFAEHLRQLGVALTVAPLPGALARTTREASLATLAMRVPAVGLHVFRLRSEFRKASLLYFNTAKALLHGMAANLGSQRPTVFHLHDLLLPEHFSRVNLRLLVAAANRADAVIANSRASADAFVAAGGHAPVTVIPNGFDPAPFDAVSQAETDALRAELNPENRPVAAIFGRLARWKGQEVLLRAAARCPDLMVWVVGEALFTGDDRAYAGELRQIAESLGLLGDRVRFLGFRRDIPALMRAADVVVHCSVAPEPFGRVLVEGMLARKPVIATRGGGADEIVGGVGLLVPPKNDAALAEALMSLSPSEREAMACNGRKRAESLYSLPAVLEKTDTLIASLLP